MKNKQKTFGIGVPGLSNDTIINYTCNLPLSGIDVTDYLKTRLPIYMSNDANCATIAEYEFVDRKMFSNYIFVTIGTGIGSGIILNGNLYIGSAGGAGEIGHIVIEKDGIPCNCGRSGCFERYASVSALLEMTELDNLDEVFYLAEKNPKIQNVIDSYIENLAEGLANVINIYEPEMLVIGGGLAEYEEKIMFDLKSKIINKIYNKFTYDFNFKIAKLKNDAGIIGASILNKYL